MEENREQPIIMPATALNAAEENSAMSEIGSQNGELGKFKNSKALLDAYNNLQSEFTKKCQMLSQLQKDKTDNLLDKSCESKENVDNLTKNQEIDTKNSEKTEIIDVNYKTIKEKSNEEELNLFLKNNFDASKYIDEIKDKSLNLSNQNPYEIAWAKVLLSHIKEGNKTSDPIINQYVLSDENVRNKILEEYLTSLNNSKPPIIISSQSGERLSSVIEDSPKTLAEAKKLVDKMFS